MSVINGSIICLIGGKHLEAGAKGIPRTMSQQLPMAGDVTGPRPFVCILRLAMSLGLYSVIIGETMSIIPIHRRTNIQSQHRSVENQTRIDMNSGPKYLWDRIGNRRTMGYFRMFVTQELGPIRHKIQWGDDHGISWQEHWK